MSESNRGAWIIAGSIVVAALIVVGGMYLLREGGAEPVAPSTPTVAKAKSPSPTVDPTPSITAEDTVRLLMIAWVQDDTQAALEHATPTAVQVLFQEPIRTRKQFVLTECDHSYEPQKVDCYLHPKQNATVEYILTLRPTSSGGYLVDSALLFVA